MKTNIGWKTTTKITILLFTCKMCKQTIFFFPFWNRISWNWEHCLLRIDRHVIKQQSDFPHQNEAIFGYTNDLLVIISYADIVINVSISVCYDCLNHKSSTRHAYCGPGYLYSHVTSMMKITLKLFLFSVLWFAIHCLDVFIYELLSWSIFKFIFGDRKNVFSLLHTHTYTSSGHISVQKLLTFDIRSDSPNKFDRMDLRLCNDSNAKCLN